MSDKKSAPAMNYKTFYCGTQQVSEPYFWYPSYESWREGNPLEREFLSFDVVVVNVKIHQTNERPKSAIEMVSEKWNEEG